MKFKYIIFFLFFFVRIFSQEYHFDRFIQYRNNFNGSIYFFMTSSLNTNYIFTGINNRNDEIYGSIIDDNYKNRLGVFSVKNINNSVSFIFDKIVELEPRNNKTFTKYYFTKNEIKIDSTKTKIVILTYTSPKLKNVKRTIEIIYDNTQEKFTTNFLNTFSHGSFLNTDFNVSIGVPLKIIMDYKNGNIVSYDILTNKRINTTLTIPK
jgi:hypothetical protein